MNQTQHDELAQLFQQNMHVSQQAAYEQQQQNIVVPQQQQPVVLETGTQDWEKRRQDLSPIHYISSHYTGTAHIRDSQSEPSRSPPPPYNEEDMPTAMAALLRQNYIDPAALLPNQVHLFQGADYEQRLRLLELWRIAPPSYPLEEHLHGTWISTSVERETDLARIRYERQQQQPSLQNDEQMDDSPIINEPLTPIRDAGEPAWPPAARMRAASIAASRPATGHVEAEEYIVNGYAADRAAKSADPVYAASAGLWQAPSYAQAMGQQQAMEDQYGMLEQIRNHADWERMNERLARERMAGAYGGGDDDMEL